MSTNAIIGKINLTTNTVHYIYLHYDGYPGHVWPILSNYNNSSRVDKLLFGGDLKSIHPEIEKCERYADRGEVVNFNEVDLSARSVPSKKFHEYINVNIEHVYLFSNVLGWKLYNQKLEQQLTYEHDGKTYSL